MILLLKNQLDYHLLNQLLLEMTHSCGNDCSDVLQCPFNT